MRTETGMKEQRYRNKKKRKKIFFEEIEPDTSTRNDNTGIWWKSYTRRPASTGIFFAGTQIF